MAATNFKKQVKVLSGVAVSGATLIGFIVARETIGNKKERIKTGVIAGLTILAVTAFFTWFFVGTSIVKSEEKDEDAAG